MAKNVGFMILGALGLCVCGAVAVFGIFLIGASRVSPTTGGTAPRTGFTAPFAAPSIDVDKSNPTVELNGRGDKVVSVEKWDGPAIVKFTHKGDSNFIVTSLDSSNDQLELLINTIGDYNGIVPIDFDGEATAGFEIKADGPWTLAIMSLDKAVRLDVPGTYKGDGSNVLVLTGDNPSVIRAVAESDDNFIVHSYGGDDLIFNEIGPYSGESRISGDAVVVSVQATGDWSVEIE